MINVNYYLNFSNLAVMRVKNKDSRNKDLLVLFMKNN